MPTRRNFLKSSLGTSAVLAAAPTVPQLVALTANAASAVKRSHQERILVVVQLSGGNDGLNTVVPFADPQYAKNRIALRLQPDAVHKLDGEVGLHPSMKTFAKLFEAGRLTVVQGVGYPNPDRSHFSSMDVWHTAQRDVTKQQEGWLGRYAGIAEHRASRGTDSAALHLGGNVLPLALVGRDTAVPSIATLEGFRLRGDAAALASQERAASTTRPDAGDMLGFLQRTTLGAFASSRRVQEALSKQRTSATYPDRGLARQLQTVAQLIDADLATSVYYVSLDGFDTHANQQASHAALLGELADSVSAFTADLAERGHLDRTCVLMFSEFGRRVKENASLGTDHGAAAPLFVAGGKLKSGVVGKHPSLERLDREGDLAFHTDFRSVYAALLQDWLGVESQSVLGADFKRLPLFA